MIPKKTLVLGASLNPDRYSNLVLFRLSSKEIDVVAFGLKSGIVSGINIDTDLRLASTAAIRKHFANDPSQFDPRKYLLDSKEWMKKIVIERLIQFGCAENASKIQPIPLKVIASQYISGELSPLIN